MLTAYCDGKQQDSHHYQVRARVFEGKIKEARCTCSIGKYGICPHIAAVLVTYSRNPEQFEPVTLLNWFKRLLGLNQDITTRQLLFINCWMTESRL